MLELSQILGTVAGVIVIPYILVYITLTMLKSIDITKRGYTVWRPAQHGLIFALVLGIFYMYGGMLRKVALMALPVLVVVAIASVIAKLYIKK